MESGGWVLDAVVILLGKSAISCITEEQSCSLELRRNGIPIKHRNVLISVRLNLAAPFGGDGGVLPRRDCRQRSNIVAGACLFALVELPHSYNHTHQAYVVNLTKNQRVVDRNLVPNLECFCQYLLRRLLIPASK